MTCQRIGRPPISTSGFGSPAVAACRRVPRPPQRITTGGSAATASALVLARGPDALAVEHEPPGRQQRLAPVGDALAERDVRVVVRVDRPGRDLDDPVAEVDGLE